VNNKKIGQRDDGPQLNKTDLQGNKMVPGRTDAREVSTEESFSVNDDPAAHSGGCATQGRKQNAMIG
jgi:hypothetical protein